MPRRLASGLWIPEQSAPATPDAGFLAVYAKSDGKLYTKNDAGTEVDLSATGAGVWSSIIAMADESKNLTAAVADDAELKFALNGTTNYMIKLRAHWVTTTAADLKYRLVYDGTTTRIRRLIRRTATSDIAVTTEVKTAFDGADVVLSTTGINPWLEEDILVTTLLTGNFKLQWSQVASGAGPTTRLEGSYIEYATS